MLFKIYDNMRGFMRIAIIDDQVFFQHQILDIVEKFCLIRNIDVFTNLNDFDNSNRFYDLVLLDVEINGVNTIPYMHMNYHKFTYVVYVTNNREHIYDAFGINVIGYIPKYKMLEFLPKKLLEARSLVQETKVYQLKSDGQVYRVPEKNILYFEFSNGFVFVALADKRKVQLTYRTLVEVYHKLSDYFWKVNRNYIVNAAKIVRVNNATHEIAFSNGMIVQVSRREWPNLKRVYKQMK